MGYTVSPCSIYEGTSFLMEHLIWTLKLGSIIPHLEFLFQESAMENQTSLEQQQDVILILCLTRSRFAKSLQCCCASRVYICSHFVDLLILC